FEICSRWPRRSRDFAPAGFRDGLRKAAADRAGRTDVRYPAETIEAMRQHLLGYRDNMRVEVETDIAVTAKTVADLRALATWPNGLALNIHVDLDPRLSVVRVERAY